MPGEKEKCPWEKCPWQLLVSLHNILIIIMQIECFHTSTTNKKLPGTFFFLTRDIFLTMDLFPDCIHLHLVIKFKVSIHIPLPARRFYVFIYDI